MTDIKNIMNKPEFPLSGKYDPEWVFDNQMGPNALWLVEWLTEALPLEPGMRVLDLGFVRAFARRVGETGFNLYDPGLGASVGVDK